MGIYEIVGFLNNDLVSHNDSFQIGKTCNFKIVDIKDHVVNLTTIFEELKSSTIFINSYLNKKFKNLKADLLITILTPNKDNTIFDRVTPTPIIE